MKLCKIGIWKLAERAGPGGTREIGSRGCAW